MQDNSKLSGNSDARKTFDVIVIGVGSMGASACYYLAEQGASVLGLEQFDIPNENSSHTGESRLIRKAYFEHPNYIPLLQRAYQNWQQLEDITGEQLYFPTGLLYMARSGHELLTAVQASASQYDITLESFDEKQLEARCPSMKMPTGFHNLFEPEAGFLLPGKAISLYTDLALQRRAFIKSKQAVQSWRRLADGVEVTTAQEKYFAKKLVITAGPWAGKLIPGLQGSLTVTRQVMAWVNTSNSHLLELGRQPCWILASGDEPGIFYGFPVLPEDNRFNGPGGFKLAHHYPGLRTDPNFVNRETTADDTNKLLAVMHDFFPGAYKSIQAVKTCLYTNTPDEHFILDFLPGHNEKVILAAGFSGHGFKFASVVGEILSDLATRGKTELPIEFLNANRFEKQGMD